MLKIKPKIDKCSFCNRKATYIRIEVKESFFYKRVKASEFFKISREHKGNLNGVKVQVTTRYYKHEQYGKCKAYNVVEKLD